MNLIDPFQFREMFAPARSFAVVGNAPTILEYEHGTKIDSHDVVVRFNRATTEGHESKIGTRTDILVVNASNSRAKAPPPCESCRPRCLVCYVSPRVAPLDPVSFGDWVGDVPILITFGPDLIGLHAKPRTRPLTSGTYIVLTLLQMFTIEHLLVTGFTMFGAKGGEAAKYYRDDRQGVGNFHDLDVEAEVFVELLATWDGKLELTPEVSELIGAERSNVSRNGWQKSLKKRIAGGLSWRVLNLGLQLRRIAESR